LASALAHPSLAAKLGLVVSASSSPMGAAPTGGPAWQGRLGIAWVFLRHHVLYFLNMLEGRRFTVYSDHKLLNSALEQISEPRTARQQRHLSFIYEFTSNLQHIFRKTNVVADMVVSATSF
jgi:hypothetical protein